MAKKWIILGDFSKKLIKPWVKSSRFGRKTQLFRKRLRKFSKISLENSKKCIILVYFQNNFKTVR